MMRDVRAAIGCSAGGRRTSLFGAVLAVLVTAAAGCEQPAETAATPPKSAAAPAQMAVEPRFAKQPDQPGLSNLVQAGDGILSGSEPEGDAGFASLAKLGVKTVVSVDGARPQVEMAKKHGLRYVHVPIGYDRIPEQAGAAYARVARECPGPCYFHCHHGQHRGPAAAAVACVALGQVTGTEALGILTAAGTGKDYAGLWRDVAAYRPPAADAPAPELPAVAQVESLTAAMADVDRHWDNLKLCRDAHWQTPAQHPDLTPAQAALLLREGFQEARRCVEDRDAPELKQRLAEVQALALELETSLRQAKFDGLDERWQTLEKSCKQCHAKFRN